MGLGFESLTTHHKKIKEGWYVEVKIENLKVRKEPDRNSAILKEA